MINAFVFKFNYYHKDPLEIKELELLGLIKVKMFVSSRKNEQYIFKEAFTIHQDFWENIEDDFEEGFADLKFLREFDKQLHLFLNIVNRPRVEKNSVATDLVRDTYAQTNLFYRLITFFLNNFRKHKIEIAFFEEIPYSASSFVANLVANKLNIKTIIFQQGIITNSCFCVSKIEQIGNLLESPLPDFSEESIIKMDKKFEIDLFYLDNKYQKLSKLEIFANRLKKRISLLRMTYILLLKILFLKQRAKLELRKSISAYIKYIDVKTHKGLLNSMSLSNPDLNIKFVIFFLHYQPELTTLPLGKEYFDQILAIEKLSSILPADTILYVKEHPMTYGAHRGKDFYSRLKSIKNTYLINEKISSYVLMEKCIFVATITGTCGFESIKGGKPVLTFGYAWYNGLPGVFPWKEDLKFEEVANYKIDFIALEIAFQNLSKKVCNFVHYWGIPSKYLKNIDRKANISKFVKAVKAMLDYPA
jgi:hypothetical protein